MIVDVYVIAVFLGICVFILYLTVPLLPSILIYKIFPKTRVAVSGPLSGLKINAGGAFAAYLIVALLAYSPVLKIYYMIGDLTHPTWTIRGTLVLRDNHNTDIANASNLMTAASVIVKPELINRQGAEIEINVPNMSRESMHVITIDIPTFGQANINLNRLDKKTVKEDYFKKIIELGQIPITQVNQPNAAYKPTGTIINPASSGPPIQPL